MSCRVSGRGRRGAAGVRLSPCGIARRIGALGMANRDSPQLGGLPRVRGLPKDLDRCADRRRNRRTTEQGPGEREVHDPRRSGWRPSSPSPSHVLAFPMSPKSLTVAGTAVRRTSYRRETTAAVHPSGSLAHAPQFVRRTAGSRASVPNPARSVGGTHPLADRPAVPYGWCVIGRRESTR